MLQSLLHIKGFLCLQAMNEELSEQLVECRAELAKTQANEEYNDLYIQWLQGDGQVFTAL